MKKWIYRILMIICLCVFCFSAYQLFLIFQGQQQVEKETQELEKYVVNEDKFLEPDWEKLQKENKDIIAWVYVPDCDISFPVVQGVDNGYYLNHTTQGEYNERGAIFLSSDANASFKDDNSLIYGHSVEGGGMFTNIKKYDNKEFFDTHSSFYLLTPSTNYECKVLSYAKTTDPSVYYTTSFGDYNEDIVSQFKSESLYFNEVDTNEKTLVSLSTCDLDYGFDSNRRLILTGVLYETRSPVKIID